MFLEQWVSSPFRSPFRLCQWEQVRLSEDVLDQSSLETLTKLVNNGHFILVK